MTEYTVHQPSSEDDEKPKPGIDIFKVGTPEEWKDFILSGRTMVRIEGPSGNADIPYDVDFVWEQNIRFTYFGAKGLHRAMYIIRPKYATAWALDNQMDGNWPLPFVVGVSSKEPGYKVLKMRFATFIDAE